MKRTACIENWMEVPCYGGGTLLIGEIKDHPLEHMFHNKRQMTTRILNINRKDGTAETKNTIYTLGKELVNG